VCVEGALQIEGQLGREEEEGSADEEKNEYGNADEDHRASTNTHTKNKGIISPLRNCATAGFYRK
jgi:hypothetical protein